MIVVADHIYIYILYTYKSMTSCVANRLGSVTLSCLSQGISTTTLKLAAVTTRIVFSGHGLSESSCTVNGNKKVIVFLDLSGFISSVCLPASVVASVFVRFRAWDPLHPVCLLCGLCVALRLSALAHCWSSVPVVAVLPETFWFVSAPYNLSHPPTHTDHICNCKLCHGGNVCLFVCLFVRTIEKVMDGFACKCDQITGLSHDKWW